MADADQIRHPVDASFMNLRYMPEMQTSSPLINMGLNTLQRMVQQDAAMPPPVNVAGHAPTDLWYMNYHGNQLREQANRLAMTGTPDVRELESLLEDTKHRNLVEQLRQQGYEGSGLQQQLLSHPAMQMMLGGNLPAGATRLLNAGQFATAGLGPISNMDVLAQRHQQGLALSGALNQVYMAQVYGLDGGMDPNLEAMMGFRAEARQNLAATMLGRGHLFQRTRDQETGRWEPIFQRGRHYVVDREGQIQVTGLGAERAYSTVGRIDPIMETLAAGRGVFGEQGAEPMLADIERFFGQEITGWERYEDAEGNEARQPLAPQFKKRLEDIAALARSVGMGARELVSVKETMQREMRALSGIDADPLTAGMPTRGRLEERAIAAAELYTRTVGYVEGQYGGPMTQAQRVQLRRSMSNIERMTSGAPLTRGMEMAQYMVERGRLPSDLEEQYRAVVQTGDRFALARTLRDISKFKFGDPETLMTAARDERAFNWYMDEIGDTMTPEMRQEAARNFLRNRNTMAATERAQRLAAARGRQRISAAQRLARSAGIRLDMPAAEEAGIGTMITAIEGREDVDADLRDELTGVLRGWQEEGVSPGEIRRRMRGLDVFAEAGFTPEELTRVTYSKRANVLAEQLQGNRERILLARKARTLFKLDPSKRREFQRALRSGDVDKASGIMASARSELSGPAAKLYERSIEGVGENLDIDLARLAGTYGETEEKKGETFITDPTLTSRFGPGPTQEDLAKLVGADINPDREEQEGAIAAQIRMGTAVAGIMANQETFGQRLVRDIPRAFKGEGMISDLWKGFTSMLPGGSEEQKKESTERVLDADRGEPIAVRVVAIETEGQRTTSTQPPRGTPRGR